MNDAFKSFILMVQKLAAGQTDPRFQDERQFIGGLNFRDELHVLYPFLYSQYESACCVAPKLPFLLAASKENFCPIRSFRFKHLPLQMGKRSFLVHGLIWMELLLISFVRAHWVLFKGFPERVNLALAESSRNCLMQNLKMQSFKEA